jgi:hypothetical protein
LASILYEKSRLVLGMGANYAQQRGGTGALAGAGEKQIEVTLLSSDIAPGLKTNFSAKRKTFKKRT